LELSNHHFPSLLASSDLQILRHNTFLTLPIYTRLTPGATLQMATPSNPISSSYSPPYQITPPTTTDSTTTQSLDKTPRNLSLEFSALSIMYPKCKLPIIFRFPVGEAIYDLVPFVIPTPRSSLLCPSDLG